MQATITDENGTERTAVLDVADLLHAICIRAAASARVPIHRITRIEAEAEGVRIEVCCEVQ